MKLTELRCSEPGCDGPAACVGLYKGGCGVGGDCEPVLEQCGDVVDDAKCEKHCTHSFTNEHCHRVTFVRPFSELSREEIRLYIVGILQEHSRETRKKRAAGICVFPECNAKALNDRTVLFFGDDHCEKHARESELECLAEDQQDELDEEDLKYEGIKKGKKR